MDIRCYYKAGRCTRRGRGGGGGGGRRVELCRNFEGKEKDAGGEGR